MQIKAAVAGVAGDLLSIEELTLERPRDREVLVRLTATGICHLDISMRDSATRVPRPIVLGHEGAGIVERVGRQVTRVVPGDAVVCTFNSCGQCPMCAAGIPAYCHEIGKYNFGGQRPDGSTALSRDGQRVHSHFFGQSSFATHAICTERNVVRVPAHAPLERLGPLGCGIQTGAGAVLNSLKVTAGSSFAVFGAGSVGLAAVMAARVAGAAKIIAVDVHDSRLEMARSLCATHEVNATRQDVRAEIQQITGSGVNFALDTTGHASVMRQAVECLAPLGTCGVLSAANASEVTYSVMSLMLAGRSVRGIHQGDSVPEKFIPHLIDLYVQGSFPFDKLVTFYPFERINEAMADVEGGKTIKAILRMRN